MHVKQRIYNINRFCLVWGPRSHCIEIWYGRTAESPGDGGGYTGQLWMVFEYGKTKMSLRKNVIYYLKSLIIQSFSSLKNRAFKNVFEWQTNLVPSL